MNLKIIKKLKRSKLFTVIDIIVVVLVFLVIGLIAWTVYRVPNGSTVIINDNGRKQTYSIEQNTVIELEHLTVHISNGLVWVDNADCFDRSCENMGRISRVGQSIVCLPNNVVITIDGEGGVNWELGWQ